MRPIIEVVAAGYRKTKNTTIPMQLDLPHCEDCTQKTTVKTLLTNDLWKMLCDLLLSQGKAQCERKTATLRWIGVGQGPFAAGEDGST